MQSLVRSCAKAIVSAQQTQTSASRPSYQALGAAQDRAEAAEGLTPRWGSPICAAPTRRTRLVMSQRKARRRRALNVETHCVQVSPRLAACMRDTRNGKQLLRRQRSDRRAVFTGEFLEPAAFFGVARRGRAPNARLLEHKKPSPSQHHSRHGLGAGVAGFANPALTTRPGAEH